MITVSSGQSTEELFTLLEKKMQPLWAFRSAVRVDRGAALELKGGLWNVRVGDVRTTHPANLARVRGCLVEVEHSISGGDGDADDDPERGPSEETENREKQQREQEEKIHKAFFETLVRGSGVSTEAWRQIGSSGVTAGPKTDQQTDSIPQETLVRQYMEILRFGRTQ